jgi:hypothetical protein
VGATAVTEMLDRPHVNTTGWRDPLPVGTGLTRTEEAILNAMTSTSFERDAAMKKKGA